MNNKDQKNIIKESFTNSKIGFLGDSIKLNENTKKLKANKKQSSFDLAYFFKNDFPNLLYKQITHQNLNYKVLTAQKMSISKDKIYKKRNNSHTKIDSNVRDVSPFKRAPNNQINSKLKSINNSVSINKSKVNDNNFDNSIHSSDNIFINNSVHNLNNNNRNKNCIYNVSNKNNLGQNKNFSFINSTNAINNNINKNLHSNSKMINYNNLNYTNYTNNFLENIKNNFNPQSAEFYLSNENYIIKLKSEISDLKNQLNKSFLEINNLKENLNTSKINSESIEKRTLIFQNKLAKFVENLKTENYNLRLKIQELEKNYEIEKKKYLKIENQTKVLKIPQIFKNNTNTINCKERKNIFINTNFIPIHTNTYNKTEELSPFKSCSKKNQKENFVKLNSLKIIKNKKQLLKQQIEKNKIYSNLKESYKKKKFIKSEEKNNQCYSKTDNDFIEIDDRNKISENFIPLKEVKEENLILIKNENNLFNNSKETDNPNIQLMNIRESEFQGLRLSFDLNSNNFGNKISNSHIRENIEGKIDGGNFCTNCKNKIYNDVNKMNLHLNKNSLLDSQDLENNKKFSFDDNKQDELFENNSISSNFTNFKKIDPSIICKKNTQNSIPINMSNKNLESFIQNNENVNNKNTLNLNKNNLHYNSNNITNLNLKLNNFNNPNNTKINNNIDNNLHSNPTNFNNSKIFDKEILNFSKKLSNSSIIMKKEYKKKYIKKFEKILTSTLGVLLEVLELYISSRPLNTARDSVLKTNPNNENASYSIDIYENSYNCEEDRRIILIDQIQSLIISKLRFMQNYSGINLEKEILKVKCWNGILNKENNSILSNISNTKFVMLKKEIKEKDVSYTSSETNSNFQNSPKFKNFSIDSFKDGNEFRLKIFEFVRDENYSVGLNDSTLKELNNVHYEYLNNDENNLNESFMNTNSAAALNKINIQNNQYLKSNSYNNNLQNSIQNSNNLIPNINSNMNSNKIIINNGVLNISLNQASNKTLNKILNPNSFGSFKNLENINSNFNSSGNNSSNINLNLNQILSGPNRENKEKILNEKISNTLHKENLELFFDENESFSQKLQVNCSMGNFEIINTNKEYNLKNFDTSSKKNKIKKANSNAENTIRNLESSKNIFLNYSNFNSNHNNELNFMGDLNTSEPIKNITFNSTFKKHSIDSEKEDYEEFDFKKISEKVEEEEFSTPHLNIDIHGQSHYSKSEILSKNLYNQKILMNKNCDKKNIKIQNQGEELKYKDSGKDIIDLGFFDNDVNVNRDLKKFDYKEISVENKLFKNEICSINKKKNKLLALKKNKEIKDNEEYLENLMANSNKTLNEESEEIKIDAKNNISDIFKIINEEDDKLNNKSRNLYKQEVNYINFLIF